VTPSWENKADIRQNYGRYEFDINGYGYGTQRRIKKFLYDQKANEVCLPKESNATGDFILASTCRVLNY
jgi:hypothetical protein